MIDRAVSVPALVLAAATLAVAEQAPDPEWTPWTTEVPLVDLTGEWEFVATQSDAMIEDWSAAPIVYRIEQTSDRVRLEFEAEGSVANVQVYRWDGSLATFQRGGQEVRERARWRGGGRVLQVEGRRWSPRDREVTKYGFEYSLDRPDLLAFTQSDDFGETVWRFRRQR